MYYVVEVITIEFETYDTLVINSLETNISTIYTIDPIVSSGKNGESLTSYLFRLANLHCVPVSSLIFYMIYLPSLEREFHRNRYNANSNINGYGKLTILTLDNLNELSEASISTKMTLDIFKDFYAKNTLLRKYKSWCKACLSEMKSEIVYEKLIWSISEYKVCTSHQSFLIDTCDKCGEKQKFNPLDGKNGHCQHCNIWLGGESENELSYCEMSMENEIYYRSKQIEDMLDYYYENPGPIKSDFISSLKRIEDISKKDMLKAELCSYLGIKLNTFNTYCKGESKFTLEKVLNISWNLKVSIVKLMHHQDIELSFNESRFIFRKRMYDHNTNKEKFKQHLSDIIKSKKYITLNQLSENLDVAPSTLKNRFPELIKEIDDNNKSLEKRFGRKLFDRDYENNYTAIYSCLIDFIHSPELVAITKIANQLNVSTRILNTKFPKIIEIIKFKNKLLIEKGKGMFHPKIDYSFIEKYLKDILATKRYITLYDISVNVNVSKEVLKKRYSDLVNKILENNQVFRNKNGRKTFEKGYKSNRTEIQDYLKEVLNSPKLIRISQITKDLGISIYLLKRWFPELIESISYKNSELMKIKELKNLDKANNYRRFKQEELISIEEKLIGYLNSNTVTPMPQNKILKELGTSGKIIKYFPEIFNKINTKNKEIKQRNQELLFRQREAILRQTIISIYSNGMYPSIKQIELNANFKIRGKLYVTRKKIMGELGIEIMQFPK